MRGQSWDTSWRSTVTRAGPGIQMTGISGEPCQDTITRFSHFGLSLWDLLFKIHNPWRDGPRSNVLILGQKPSTWISLGQGTLLTDHQDCQHGGKGVVLGEIWEWRLAGKHNALCKAYGTVICSTGRASCEEGARMTGGGGVGGSGSEWQGCILWRKGWGSMKKAEGAVVREIEVGGHSKDKHQ